MRIDMRLVFCFNEFAELYLTFQPYLLIAKVTNNYVESSPMADQSKKADNSLGNLILLGFALQNSLKHSKNQKPTTMILYPNPD